ncbi:FAD-binding protein [Peribacillus frigoritolerans]|nr:FAD-binding protein [Peribacillus frigoritolerans]
MPFVFQNNSLARYNHSARSTKDEKKYDLLIIGGGPAGLSAGVYAGRAKLKTIILEKRNWRRTSCNYIGNSQLSWYPSYIGS